MAMSSGGPGKTAAEINMTPMIDVLLVLIIIFMVITPIAPKGLEARLPEDSRQPKAPVEDDRALVVSVGKDLSLRINQEVVAEEALGQRLTAILRTRASRVCFVKGDGELEYLAVARVIDVAKGAGADAVGLLTKDTN